MGNPPEGDPRHDDPRHDDPRDLEQGLRSLYEDAPVLPAEVVRSALDESRATRQRRFGPIPVFRSGRRGSPMALVRPIAAALVLVAGGFALANFLAQPQEAPVAPAASQLPSPSPTPEAPETGARIVVAQDGSGDADTIASALEMASEGDTLLIRPGTYVGGVTLDRDVTIRGDGPREAIVVTATAETPTIDLDEKLSYAFLIRDSNATLSGLTLRNAGATAFAPIVAVGGAPTIEDIDAGGTIRLTDASDATVRGNRMAGLEMTGELGDPQIADNVTTASRAEVEQALGDQVSLDGCDPWREADEPFSFGSTGAVRCADPRPNVSQMALFAFPDAGSLERFWQWRTDGPGASADTTPIDCGDGRVGVSDWQGGSLTCYEDAASGVAKIRWIDRQALTYGVLDATGSDVEPAHQLWQEQTQP